MATKIHDLVTITSKAGLNIPKGDMLIDNSLTRLSYNFLNKDNNFYSSEYLTKLTKLNGKL